MSLLTSFEQKFNWPDLGLLILRVVFGAIILIFGVGKLIGGGDMLAMIGGALAKFGLTKFPMVWGLLAALTETLGGICILFGIFFRPAALLLFFNMVVATSFLWGAGPHLASYGDLLTFLGTINPPLAFCTVFLALLFTGPGKYAIQKSGGGRSKSASQG